MAAKGKYRDLDELFRVKLEDYPVEPGIGFRNELMRKVSRREFLRFNPSRFNIYYLAAAAATVSVALVLTFSDVSSEGRSDNKLPANDTTANESVLSNPEEKLFVSDTIPVQGNKTSGNKLTTKPLADKHSNDLSESKFLSQEQAIMTKTDTIKASKAETDGLAGRGTTQTERKVLSSSFTVSATSGCVPLRIVAVNTSTNFERIMWSSGDGRVSDQNSIEWDYIKPGTYTLVLKSIGSDGSENLSSEVITVHPSPQAKFDVAPANKDISDREILLYNYSEGSLTSKWEFGDGESSLMREPLHVYEKAGDYRILLTVTNEYGCSDTASAIYSTSRGAFAIEFPNAFIPNANGPTGGHYSPRSDEAANVFHPEYEGVTDYYLVIYSRTGAIIFETRNLNIGWDGYYKGQLCDPGVYIWRSRGRFANGEQFMKSGDVTLLRF